MNFNIDPKDLNLQDAAGMQLVEVIRNLADESGTTDYEDLENLPKINSVELKGNKTTGDLNISYNDLDNLPKINGVELTGNKSTSDLNIEIDPSDIASAVDDWCDTNVAQESGYVLDSTLTMSNAAAPADKVGDVKEEINYRTPSIVKYRDLDIEPGSVLASDGSDYDDTDTVLWYRRNATPVFLKKDTVVNFLPHYRGRVFGYSSESVADFNSTDSQWLAGTLYTIPADAYYRIVIGLVAADWPSRNIADWQIDGVEIYWGKTGKEFADSENRFFPVSKSYVNGEPLNFKRQAVYTRLLGISLPSQSIAEGLTARQDFAIYGNTLLQLFSDDYCALVDLETGNLITHFQIDCGHCNAAQFGTKFYNISDSYPLLYCFDYADAKVYVNRVTTSGATLVETITIPISDGYRFSGGVDDENNILYLINYKINSSTTATDNGCDFSAWDISGETPVLLHSATLNQFIPVISGCVYKNGYLWVSSGSLNDDSYGIYKIDQFGNLVSWYRESSNSGEAEGLDFWDEENSLKSRLLYADLSLHEIFYL